MGKSYGFRVRFSLWKNQSNTSNTSELGRASLQSFDAACRGRPHPRPGRATELGGTAPGRNGVTTSTWAANLNSLLDSCHIPDQKKSYNYMYSKCNHIYIYIYIICILFIYISIYIYMYIYYII